MADTDQQTAYALSADRYTMVIRRRTPSGIQTVTIRRQDDAGPFTDEDVAAALEWPPGDSWQPGQRNIARRKVTRAGTLWTHVMHGPPTWWLPRLKRERDGTVMAGWLRLAVAAKWERAGAHSGEDCGDGD